MENPWHALNQAILEHDRPDSAVKANADTMARRLAGRLRDLKISGMTLTQLKRELRAWDMHRGTWVDR